MESLLILLLHGSLEDHSSVSLVSARMGAGLFAEACLWLAFAVAAYRGYIRTYAEGRYSLTEKGAQRLVLARPRSTLVVRG